MTKCVISDLAPNYFGVELWPGRIFTADEGGSLFGQEIGNLYTDTEWANVQPWLDEWRQKRSRSFDRDHDDDPHANPAEPADS